MSSQLSGTGALAGRRALVTGASRGIGLATASMLASEGASVFGLARRWPQKPANLVCLQGDVADEAALEAAVAAAAGEDGLDICVANAAAFIVEDWMETDPQQWRRVIDVNLISVMRLFQLSARSMIATGRGGRLLVTTSTAGMRADAWSPAYSASKAGVISVVQSAALAFAPHGITANAVAPGPIDTDMTTQAVADLAAANGTTPEQEKRKMGGQLPLGRLGEPDDIAGLLTYLASDRGAFITGCAMRVDGGELLI